VRARGECVPCYPRHDVRVCVWVGVWGVEGGERVCGRRVVKRRRGDSKVGVAGVGQLCDANLGVDARRLSRSPDDCSSPLDLASRLVDRICVQVRQAFTLRMPAVMQISASGLSSCRLAASSDRIGQGLPPTPNSCEDVFVTSDTGLKLFTVSSAGSSKIRLAGTRAQASKSPCCLHVLSSRHLHLVHSRSSI
jgi:hypothetical protein